MTETEFQQTLSEFKHREPFRPFVIELEDGPRIEVDEGRALAFSEGGGCFFSPDYEIVDFRREEVEAVRTS